MRTQPVTLKEAEQIRKTAQKHGFLVAYIIVGNEIKVEVKKK